MPLLNRIISPPLRPVRVKYITVYPILRLCRSDNQVNKQIIKANEKLVLNRLVEIMISTGLSYQQDKTEDGQLMYRLEP